VSDDYMTESEVRHCRHCGKRVKARLSFWVREDDSDASKVLVVADMFCIHCGSWLGAVEDWVELN